MTTDARPIWEEARGLVISVLVIQNFSTMRENYYNFFLNFESLIKKVVYFFNYHV